MTYAVEGHRRIKEQRNKRKPDDKFANLQRSYIRADGPEVVVYCPESRHAVATQQPVRKALDDSRQAQPLRAAPTIVPKELPPQEVTPAPLPLTDQDTASVLHERHFTILYGDPGYSYESILGPYWRGAKELTVEDPYIRLPHQLQNFVRFCDQRPQSWFEVGANDLSLRKCLETKVDIFKVATASTQPRDERGPGPARV